DTCWYKMFCDNQFVSWHEVSVDNLLDLEKLISLGIKRLSTQVPGFAFYFGKNYGNTDYYPA
ncbi:MAG: hypothetical protein ABW079_16910, partial [Sedimenticola sp.]